MLSLLRDEKARNNAIQASALAFVTMVVLSLIITTHNNLAAQGITSGFGFLQRTTGWAIPFSLLDYTIRDQYWRVLLIGFLNTLFIGLFSLFFATIFGTLIGIARIARNPLLQLIGTVYVEIFRNIPLILQAFFWYAIATHLPPPRRALELWDIAYLSSRGVFIPSLNITTWSAVAFVACAIAIIIIGMIYRSRASAAGSTPRFGVWLACMAGAIVLAAIVAVLLGREANASLFVVPQLKGLRFDGGFRMIPEFSALAISIIVFGSAYIAEIVRGGFNAVHRGQLECARALGLRPWMVMVNVHIPLALRAIVPPLGNMYVWLMKATTLGIAIGFSDLFMIVSTSINQSGQTIELLLLMMTGFFIINYSISSLMNLLNRSIALKGYENDPKSMGAEL
ncbi:MAG: general L-amino acid transport system permease protein [Gammaproteobacteria bacterium]|jgi:general L-amino acid transport system permease protein